MPKHTFTGVFIPANIWLSKELSPAEKMILGEVDALSKETGWCYAGRKHFSEWLHCTPSNVSYYISRLEEIGYLQVERRAGERSKMQIINERFYETGSKSSLPGSKEGLPVGSKSSLPGSKEGLLPSYIKEKNKKEIQEEENGAALAPPFQKIEEVSILEAEKNTPSITPGRGAIRVTITDPNMPDVKIVDEIPPGPKTRPPKGGRTSEEIEFAGRVVAHLNKTAGRTFRTDTDANTKIILARLKDGFTEEEMRQVIEFKTNQWGADPKMSQYITPATLFRAGNFENYLQAAKSTPAQSQQKTFSLSNNRSGVNAWGGDMEKYKEKQIF